MYFKISSVIFATDKVELLGAFTNLFSSTTSTQFISSVARPKASHLEQNPLATVDLETTSFY